MVLVKNLIKASAIFNSIVVKGNPDLNGNLIPKTNPKYNENALREMQTQHERWL